MGVLSTITKGKPGPTDEVVAKLAKKYGVSEEAVCLRWVVCSRERGLLLLRLVARRRG